MPFSFIPSRLAEQRREGLWRSQPVIQVMDARTLMVDGQRKLSFAGNDYLGMARRKEVIDAWHEGLSQYGAGSTASPLVVGHGPAHGALEAYLAELTGREAVLLFSTGYAANQALLQALGQDGCAFFLDKLSHASLIDGVRCSKAPFKRFAHNDMSHLERLLAAAPANDDTLVVSEGVFSMDGDKAPLASLVELCRANGAPLLIDDAHGFGVLGSGGVGSTEGYSQDDVAILMGTFGKAVGTQGAFIAGSFELIDYLINFARPHIYSTHTPPAQAHATLAALRLIRANPQWRQQLAANIALFRALCREAGLPLKPSDTAIQPLLLGCPMLTLRLQQALADGGIWVGAIRSPTVPKGSDRLRITLNACHTREDIHRLVDTLCTGLAAHKAMSDGQ